MSEIRTLAMIGLGKMGSNMVRRLLLGGHRCVVYDVDPSRAKELSKEGATPASTIDELVSKLDQPRIVWMMLPAGEITEKMARELGDRLEGGDILIDGGNSHFKDDVRRHGMLKEKGIEFMDVGTSGGVWGAERGYCLMIGGSREAFGHVEPVFRTLAPGAVETADDGEVHSLRPRAGGTAMRGYLYCGASGAGHFVKMIHNGIEYGMMESFAEGFDIMKNSGYDLDLPQVAEVWRRGSVVSSWLLDLIALALGEDAELGQFTGFVEDSGEGRWTLQAAIEEAVPANVLAAALFTRFRSRREHGFAEKMLSAMRRQFGGHLEPAPRSRRAAK